MKLCACGCGKPAAPDTKYVKYRYKRGHSSRCGIAKFPLADLTELLLSPPDEDLRHRYLWRLNAKGYVCGGPGLIHRQVIERVSGPIEKGLQVDHINENKLDNRRENLRLVTGSQNVRNVLAPRKSKKTPGPRGVYPTPYGRWQVLARYRDSDGKYKTKHLGCFKTVEEAAKCFEDYKRGLDGFVPPEERLAS